MGETDAVESGFRLKGIPMRSTAQAESQEPHRLHQLQSLVEPDVSNPITKNSMKDQSQGILDPELDPQPTNSPKEVRPTRFVVSPNYEDDDSTWHSQPDDNPKQESNEASKRLASEAPHLRDIIGHEEVKQRIAELTLPLFLPESILQSVFKGIRRLPTTILFHGPPGCGKVRTSIDRLQTLCG